MMRIAVVDDNKKDLMETVALLKEFFIHNWGLASSELQIDEFLSGDKFIDSHKAGIYQLVVLDIYMSGKNGIDSAKTIRKFHDDCHIIFVTNSQEHMLMGYEVFADGYIMKPVAQNKEKLFFALIHCFGQKKDDNILRIRTVKNMVEISIDKLIYVDVGDNRRCIFHTTQSEIESTVAYSDCLNMLGSETRFLECYHRLIVNMDYIEEMNAEDFVMTNGKIIPISRRKKSQVAHKYMEYLVIK